MKRGIQWVRILAPPGREQRREDVLCVHTQTLWRALFAATAGPAAAPPAVSHHLPETGGTGVTTATEGPQTAPSAGPAASPAVAGQPARLLGWAAAAASTASVVLMIVVLASGPSAVVPKIPRAWPAPPLWFPLHPSQTAVTIEIYAAIVLGAAGVCCGLAAVRRGVRPRIRLLMAGAVIAAIALAVLPPGGSTDSLSYAAYGRIAVLGHNPYVMTPAQLRATGDPIGLQTTRNWEHDPSLYGPVATVANWAAAEIGGTNISFIVLCLKVLFAVSFLSVAVALDRMLRRDPAARARAHLLWTVNPLMLWATVGGAHADGLGAALGILGILVARTGTGRLSGTRTGMARAFGAGLLAGAAAAVKAPLFPLGLGLVWAVRRSLRDFLAVAAGGALVVGGGYLIAGPSAISDLWSTGNSLVTFDSFWRLFYPPFGYTSEPAGLELFAALAFAVMIALLAWRLPAGPLSLPAVRPALVVMVAWLLVWPLQRPWYDAAAFCLLAVYPATRLDWLMLIRAVPAAMAVANGAASGPHPQWVSRMTEFVGYDLTRYVRLGAAVAAAALCVLAAWELRRRREGNAAAPASSSSAA
jgi:hypothetical protein